MKLGIKIDYTHYLDLYEDTTVTIELRNPAIKPSDPDILPGSFSLPFRIPMSVKNAALLHHAHLIASTPEYNFIIGDELVDSAPPIYQGRHCQIIYDGVPLIEGTAYVQKADNTSAFIHVVVGKMPDLKDINLTDIDYGDTIDISADPTNHARDTALNPENHNHIFFPVYNTQFFSQADPEEEDLPDIDKDENKYHNFFVNGFVDEEDALIATPFVKHNYILERIFLHLNYHIDNQFNAEGELANLCIYNNNSIYTEDLSWGENINYNNHVPAIPAADFVRETCKLFALGLFTPPFTSGEVLLKPLRDVLNSEPEKDWNKYTHHSYEVEFDDLPIRKIGFDPNYVNDLNNNFIFDNEFATPENYTIIDNEAAFLNNNDEGWFFIISTNRFAFKFANGDTTFSAFRMPEYVDPNIERDTSLLMKLAPVVPVRATAIRSGGFIQWVVPNINTPGTFAPFGIAAEYPVRLLLYRGIQISQVSFGSGEMSYPMASANIYDITETKIADQSLLWQGEEGLYNTFWKEWHYTQRFNKRVRRRFNLPLSEIITFNFDQLIHSESQTYMVESMRITLTPQGIKPIDTVMMQINTAFNLQIDV